MGNENTVISLMLKDYNVWSIGCLDYKKWFEVFQSSWHVKKLYTKKKRG